MNSTNAITCLGIVVLAVTVVGTSPTTAESLGDTLREHRWDRIIGTWVDEDTRGAAVKATYAWKFKNQLIEVTTKIGERETVALMGRNAKTGEVFYIAGDNQGGSSLGKWKLESGDAILELGYVTPDGQEGELSIRHHLQDDDTLRVTINENPSTFTLVREKK